MCCRLLRALIALPFQPVEGSELRSSLISWLPFGPAAESLRSWSPSMDTLDTAWWAQSQHKALWWSPECQRRKTDLCCTNDPPNQNNSVRAKTYLAKFVPWWHMNRDVMLLTLSPQSSRILGLSNLKRSLESKERPNRDAQGGENSVWLDPGKTGAFLFKDGLSLRKCSRRDSSRHLAFPCREHTSISSEDWHPLTF